MKIKLELFGASKEFSDKEYLSLDLRENSSIKDLRNKIIKYVDEKFKGNENFKKIIETSAFCSEDNNIISDNYQITKDQKLELFHQSEAVNAPRKNNRSFKKKKLKMKMLKILLLLQNSGASILFYGTVRENNENKKVTGITYDSHDELVIKSFKEIYNEADQKLKIKEKSVFIEHVKGYVGLGEISIIIAVACPHRSEAYDLSRYIIEEIKKRSPIWKKEHYENSSSDWLKGNPIQAS